MSDVGGGRYLLNGLETGWRTRCGDVGGDVTVQEKDAVLGVEQFLQGNDGSPAVVMRRADGYFNLTAIFSHSGKYTKTLVAARKLCPDHSLTQASAWITGRMRKRCSST